MHFKLPLIENLHKEGRLHKRLVVRLIMFVIILFIIGGVLGYDILFKGLMWMPVVGFASFGFILGFFVFRHITKITWDEEKEVVSIGKFDVASFIILIIYVAYRVLVKLFLESHFTSAIAISGFSLAILFGGMAGRLIGTRHAIKRTHQENSFH